MSIGAVQSSLSGMTAATKRMEAAASNIANARSTGAVPDAEGQTNAYRPVEVTQVAPVGGGVMTNTVPKTPPFQLQFEPDSPEANAKGLVASPNVDTASELTDVLQARINYAASAKVMKTAADMQRTAIDTLS